MDDPEDFNVWFGPLVDKLAFETAEGIDRKGGE